MTDALASGLADTLMRAAQDHVAKAQQMLDQTKALVEIIHTQVAAQAKQNEDMNARFKQVGERMLDVHRILNGDIASGLGPLSQHGHAVEPAPSRDFVKLRALGDAYGSRDLPAGSSTFSPNPATDPKRDPNYPARQRELPRAVGGASQFDPGTPNRPGENHRDPGVGSKQPDRD